MTRPQRIGLLCLVLGLAAGCGKKSVPTPDEGGAGGAKADKARKDAEGLAVTGVEGGASAQAKAVPGTAVKRDLTWLNGRVAVDRTRWRVSLRSSTAAKTPDPKDAPAPVPGGKAAPPVRPGPVPVLRERVCSLPYPTEAEADEDAVDNAVEVVNQKLTELDSPVRHKVTSDEVRAQYLRKDTRSVRAPDAEEKDALAKAGVTANLFYVEYDIELTAEQVRDLRARERLVLVLRALGGLIALVLAGTTFLRGDQWTGGASPALLAVLALALACGGVAAAVFAFP